MSNTQKLVVSEEDTLIFFFERLKDVAPANNTPRNELLYNASLLAHFATTSTQSQHTFPATPSSLKTFFDLYVMDQSGHKDASIMEGAASQCLLLTGYFGNQQRQRHNVEWYAELGVKYYYRAANLSKDAKHAHMMTVMSERFWFWREQQARLNQMLEEQARFNLRLRKTLLLIH